MLSIRRGAPATTAPSIDGLHSQPWSLGKLVGQGAGVAAKLLESITGPHLAPQSVDIEFSSHGLALPIAICSTVYTGAGQPLDSFWKAGQAKPRTYFRGSAAR